MPLIILGVLLYIGFTLYTKSYFSFQPQGSRYKSGVDSIEQYLRSQQARLVQFDKDELPLLSDNLLESKKNLFIEVRKNEGILTSIYHEPFVAFRRLHFDAAHKTGIIGAATKQDVYIFILKKDHTDVFINQRPYGTIKAGGRLFKMNKSEPVAAYELHDHSYLVTAAGIPTMEVGLNRRSSDRIPQRLFTIFGPDPEENYELNELMGLYLGISQLD